MMNRRQALRRASLLIGASLSAPLLAGANGLKINTFTGIEPSPQQRLLVAELADIILPTTDTPGAKTAQTEAFVCRVLRDCYPLAEQQNFYKSLENFDKSCSLKYGNSLNQLSASNKIAAVKDLTQSDSSFFLAAKALIITGYFTSEIGATKALAYEAVPGHFDGCMPLAAGQKTWATN
jgi:fructoselysine-6-P-deglycase FrlB-like protein